MPSTVECRPSIDAAVLECTLGEGGTIVTLGCELVVLAASLCAFASPVLMLATLLLPPPAANPLPVADPVLGRGRSLLVLTADSARLRRPPLSASMERSERSRVCDGFLTSLEKKLGGMAKQFQAALEARPVGRAYGGRCFEGDVDAPALSRSMWTRASLGNY